MMQIEQLVYLVEVNKTKSISRAAERVFVTPQNISNAIRKLEKEYGLCLLHRSSSGVALLPAGEEFVRIAEEILLKCKELEQLKPTPNEAYRFRYFQPFSINTELTSKKISEFCRKNPGYRITVSNKEQEEILEILRRDRLAGGLLLQLKKEYREEAYIDMGLEVVKTKNDRLVLFASEKLPIAKQKSTSIQEVLRHPIVRFEYLCNSVRIMDTLRRHGDPNIILSTCNGQLFWETVSSGAAVGFAMEGMSEKNAISERYHLKAVPVRSRGGDFEYVFFLLRNKKSEMSRLEQTLLLQML
ncbi:MAG: LysR family transcriptional regulator [Gracilibacteraceae bacterium]|jgi:DNA-binding transcriptional LysR family regulator|nr:LysR family transcriptional regulator [Gracilibacteraceae bacterium]